MSFLKITDPTKRDFIVEEFLTSKKNIQQSSLNEKMGDVGLQQALTKLYKPITENQTQLSKDIKESSAALQALPASITSSLKSLKLPQYPSIQAYEHSDEPLVDVKTLELGDIAVKYLKQYASHKKSADTTFGINAKNGVFHLGDTPITIQGDNITIRNKEYAGTPGLWELLTMVNPNKTIYDVNDLENYAQMLHETNAIRQPNNPNKPKSSRSDKYREIIKPIWDTKVLHGKGVSSTILPSDPDALVEMLSLRMASYKAGNSGVRNEVISICDELLRQEVLSKEQYKKLMLQI